MKEKSDMNFSLRDYIKNAIISQIRQKQKDMTDSQLILNAAGWHNKGVLTIEDLEEIQTALNNQNQ